MRSDRQITLDTKKKMRKYCLEKLGKARKSRGYKSNLEVLERVEKVLENIKFHNILVYLPLKNEVDLRKCFPKWRKKYNLLVPFMQGISFKVVKYRLPIFKKKFSIYEPRDSLMNFSNIDVMIVPVVGVDGILRRIGFGKGMYDRFFESLKRRPLVIFVQLDCCCTKFMIGDTHDIQADIYITPQKTIFQRGIDDNRSRNCSRNSYSRSRSRVFCSKKDK